jgi:hypothetical protein
MPVDALPPPPPVVVDATTLPEVESGRTHAYGQYRIHFLGDMPISKDEIRYLLDKAPDVDTLVAALSEIAHARSDRLGRMHVAILPGELILMWQPARIAQIKGTEGIKRYFYGLADSRGPGMEQLERQRLLSSVHADRASLHVRPQFRPADNGDLVLATYGEDMHKAPGYLTAGYTNAGNRYVGENLFDIEAGTRTHGGTDLSLTARTATGSESTNAQYREGGLGVNRVAPIGILDLSTRLLAYETEIQGTPVEGDIQSLSLSWLQVLAADGASRKLLSLGVSGNRESLTIANFDPLDQEYIAAELDLQSSRQAISSDWRADGGLRLIYPLTSENETAPAGNDWLSGRLNASLSYEPSWQLRLALSGQAARDQVPNAQQWSIGGQQRMAAFRPGSLIGDYGYHGRLSLGAPELRVGRASARLSVFAEHGGVGRNAEEAEEIRALSNGGIELKADWRSTNQLKMTAGLPFGEPDADIDTMNLFISARIGFK